MENSLNENIKTEALTNVWCILADCEAEFPSDLNSSGFC